MQRSLRTIALRTLALTGTAFALCLSQHTGAATWTTNTPLITPRFGHTATMLQSGKVLVAGGRINADFVTNTAELFDPATGKSVMTGSLSIKRDNHTATLLNNGKVLVVGGLNSGGTVYRVTLIRQPSSKTAKFWLPEATIRHGFPPPNCTTRPPALGPPPAHSTPQEARMQPHCSPPERYYPLAAKWAAHTLRPQSFTIQPPGFGRLCQTP